MLSPDTKVGQTGEKKNPFSNKNGYVWTGPKIARVHVIIVVVVVLSKHVVELFTLTFVFLGSNEPGSL